MCICTETTQRNTWLSVTVPRCCFNCSIIYSDVQAALQFAGLAAFVREVIGCAGNHPNRSSACTPCFHRVAFAAVIGTSCHPTHSLIILHFKDSFNFVPWSLLVGFLRVCFLCQCLEEPCQIHAQLFFWWNYCYSEKLYFHSICKECTLREKNLYPVSVVTVQIKPRSSAYDRISIPPNNPRLTCISTIHLSWTKMTKGINCISHQGLLRLYLASLWFSTMYALHYYKCILPGLSLLLFPYEDHLACQRG